MDVADIALKVAVPILGLVGGWVGAAWRIQTRVKELEGKYKALRQGFVLELGDHKETFAERFDELKLELRDVRDHLEKFRDSQVDYAREAQLARFVMEQQERWELVQRTLGRLEGELGRRSFPPRR